MALRITVVSLLLALFIFQASAKSVKHAKHEKGMFSFEQSKFQSFFIKRSLSSNYRYTFLSNDM